MQKTGVLSSAERGREVSDHSNSLAGQASVLPLNDLPLWVRDAITEAADELDVDPLELATIFTVHLRKSELNHDETHTPHQDRQAVGVLRGVLRVAGRKRMSK